MLQVSLTDSIIDNVRVSIEGLPQAFHSVCPTQNVSIVASDALSSHSAGRVFTFGLLLQATIPGQTMVMIRT